MPKLLHLSDLHFGPPLLPQVAEAALRFAQRTPHDVLVVSGDFTQRAKREQFREAYEYLARFPNVPRVVTPGNHDIPLYRVWERLTAGYQNYREAFGSPDDLVLRHAGLTIVTLNTTSPLRRITEGRIRPEQLEFARREFAAAPADSIKLVVAHHPFAPPGDRERDRPIRGAAAALQEFSTMGVEAILGGHLHRSYLGSSLDIAATAATDEIVLIQAGTATSSRGRVREKGRNTLNVIEFLPYSMLIQVYEFQPTLGDFSRIAEHSLPRRGQGHMFGREET